MAYVMVGQNTTQVPDDGSGDVVVVMKRGRRVLLGRCRSKLFPPEWYGCGFGMDMGEPVVHSQECAMDGGGGGRATSIAQATKF